MRPGAGGYEAERDTWVRKPRRFTNVTERAGQTWKVTVAGDARPLMRRLRIEALAPAVDSPFVLSDKSYDFRSVPDLVRSVTAAAQTPEQKALAIRELLIGEGFFFHFSPPLTSDPVHRLTNAGYGYCGTHVQLFDQLGQAAGLRTAVCSHPFGTGHATNQVFFDGQWHFIDSNAETVIRRPDGVIPSFDEIRNNPELVPPGDAYGQTSFGIDGSRFVRALYTSATKCYERPIKAQTEYASLAYSLRAGDSITWEWQDSDFRKNRANQRPVFGTGTIEQHPRLNDFRPVESTPDRSAAAGVLSASGTLRFQLPVVTPYPALQVSLSARMQAPQGQAIVRISGDNGKTWTALSRRVKGNSIEWQAAVADPDKWQDVADSEVTDETSRVLTAGRYRYLLEIQLSPAAGSAASLSDLRLSTQFRHYPPAMPFLKVGDNQLTYVAGLQPGKVRITMDWEERSRPPAMAIDAASYGWGTPTVLSKSGDQASLPAINAGATGGLQLVYSVGTVGSRQIALRQYESGSWSKPRLITPRGQDANHAVVAQDVAGTIWVAYQTGGLWAGGDVWVVSIKKGTASEPVQLNTAEPYHIAFFPSITANKNGVTVSWEGGQSDKDKNTAWGTEIGWIRQFDGTAWGEPVAIKGKPFVNLGLPKVHYDARGRLHLTATKGPRYYLTLSESRDQFQWLTPEWMYHSRGASFFDDEKGNLWATFDGQNSGTTNEIYVRMLPARAADTTIGKWTKAMRISEDDKKPSIYPDLVTLGEAWLAVVWMDYRHKNSEIYGKVFAGGRWSPDLLLSSPAPENARQQAETMTPNQILWARPEGLQSEYPHIAKAADGTIWAVWQETEDGNPTRVLGRPLHPQQAPHQTTTVAAKTKEQVNR